MKTDDPIADKLVALWLGWADPTLPRVDQRSVQKHAGVDLHQLPDPLAQAPRRLPFTLTDPVGTSSNLERFFATPIDAGSTEDAPTNSRIHADRPPKSRT